MEIGENRSLPLEDSRTGEILMSLTQCFESIYYIYLQHDAFYSPVQGGQALSLIHICCCRRPCGCWPPCRWCIWTWAPCPC